MKDVTKEVIHSVPADRTVRSQAPGLAVLRAEVTIPHDWGEEWITYYTPADLYDEEEDNLQQQVMRWIIVPDCMEYFESGFHVNWDYLSCVTAETPVETTDVLIQSFWVTEAEELTVPESALLPIPDSPVQALQRELRFQKALRQHKADRRTGGNLQRVPKSLRQRRIEHWLTQMTGTSWELEEEEL